MGGATGRRVGLGPLPLLRHQRAETRLVDGQTGLGGHFQSQVDGEPVGVVQLEDLVPGQLRTTGLPRLRHRRIEDPGSGGQRHQKSLFLGPGHRLDPLVVRDQLRVRRTHRVSHHRSDLAQDGFGHAEQAH